MNNENHENNPCYYFHFGLIVTGKGEREHLPKLFKSLMSSNICTFSVIEFIGQRTPISSEKKILKMLGKGKTIPDKDIEQIGFPARRYLSNNLCNFLVLIDDLEHDRRELAQQIFQRYRTAMDTLITNEEKRRASVHFLVNMLEAYYFADAGAVNSVLSLNPPSEDYPGDVEDIRHPKNELKSLYPGFREIDDGGKILDLLDVGHVLDRPNTCKGLRTLFKWCVEVLKSHTNYQEISSSLSEKYRLKEGLLSEITKVQLSSEKQGEQF